MHTELSADSVELPTRKHDGFLFVEVRINDTGPYLLMIDSGADGLILEEHVARDAGLRILSRVRIRSIDSVDVVTGRAAEVDRLDCGGFAVRGMTAMLLPDDANSHFERRFGQELEGILGMAAFTDVVLELDLPRGGVSVVRPGAASYPPERSVRYDGIVPQVQVDVAGKVVACLIDTGSESYVGMPDLANLPLQFPPIKADGFGTMGLGAGNQRHETSQLAGVVNFGPVTLTRPPIDTDSTGRIGNRVLAHWKVVFDHGAQTIYLLGANQGLGWKPITTPDVSRKAGFFCTIEGDAIRLVEVDQGFPFDRAGLRAGDLVLSVDGESAVAWVDRSPYWDSDTGPFQLRIRRGSSAFDAVVTFALPADR